MQPWRPLTVALLAFLVNGWPETIHNRLLVLGLHNHTRMAMGLWQIQDISPEAYCRILLFRLQYSECPFMRLVFHCILALPIYNLLLIVICWYLNRSASKTVERIVLVFQPIEQRSTPDPPAEFIPYPSRPPLSLLPPLPPPRCKRRRAPQPPQRAKSPQPRQPAPRIICHSLSVDCGYPSEKDPFLQGFCDQEQYKSLRRHLKLVLEGLQQPSHSANPQSMPITLCSTGPLKLESAESSSTDFSLEMPKKKAKSRKLLHNLFKRLGKPFVRNRREKQKGGRKPETNANSSADVHQDKAGVFSPLWQRLKIHTKQQSKLQLSLSSSESLSSISSSQCLYAS